MCLRGGDESEMTRRPGCCHAVYPLQRLFGSRQAEGTGSGRTCASIASSFRDRSRLMARCWSSCCSIPTSTGAAPVRSPLCSDAPLERWPLGAAWELKLKSMAQRERLRALRTLASSRCAPGFVTRSPHRLWARNCVRERLGAALARPDGDLSGLTHVGGPACAQTGCPCTQLTRSLYTRPPAHHVPHTTASASGLCSAHHRPATRPTRPWRERLPAAPRAGRRPAPTAAQPRPAARAKGGCLPRILAATHSRWQGWGASGLLRSSGNVLSQPAPCRTRFLLGCSRW
jgi:hypothetical protein